MSLRHRLEAHARRKRFAATFRPMLSISRILDVGGTYAYWQTVPFDEWQADEIVLLNVTAEDVPAPFVSIAGDARDLSRFADQSFDLVFSNSVIGHVGTFADQQQMAREIRRVGRRYILQTPNHYCPIDWRTLVPGFHWLPAEAQAWCFRRMRVGTYPKADSDATAWEWATRVRNLTRRELASLFPDGRIATERIAGVAKSFVVTR
jgi:ubiquinone/menaquinone biosynthesis C-methylase UbiE